MLWYFIIIFLFMLNFCFNINFYTEIIDVTTNTIFTSENFMVLSPDVMEGYYIVLLLLF